MLMPEILDQGLLIACYARSGNQIPDNTRVRQ
jgi:hypothetical protein